jgi:hypothetical protein
MKEPAIITKSEARPTHGVVPGVAHLALDLVERGQSTTIAVLQDARVELKVVIDHGIEFAEKSAASLFRFARKLGQRVDEGVAETLGHADRYLSGAVKSARETATAATELAHTAGTSLAGHTASA